MTTTNNAVIEKIAAEFNVTADKITNVRSWDVNNFGGFLSFYVNGREYTNKLTATGKHKKNSVRLATW